VTTADLHGRYYNLLFDLVFDAGVRHGFLNVSA
jgi:hypothetical protein